MTTHSSGFSQSNQDSFDTGPLSWVMGEIREALTRSKTAIDEAVNQEVEARATSLRHAKSYLHQAHGALQMVDVDGVAIITETVEDLLDRIDARQLVLTEDLAQVISHAYLALTEYLEELLSGVPHQPVRLFPYYGALLQARGAERIHPADLFFPNLAVRPQLPALEHVVEAKAGDYVHLRQSFEKALLPFLKNTDHGAELANAGRMRDIVAEIEKKQTNSQSRAFWWVMHGFTEAVSEDRIQNEIYVKQLFARINLQIRRLSQGSLSIAERLLRDALFFIAKAKNPSVLSQQIRHAYELEGLVPVDYEKRRYGQIDADALTKAKERLSHVKDMWARVVEGDDSQAASFEIEMQGLVASGSKLNSPELAKLLRELGGIARHATHVKPTEDLALEMAAGLLFVENAMQNIARLPDNFAGRAETMTARLLSVVSGEKPTEPMEWLEDMTRHEQQKQTLQALGSEMQANLRQAEKTLDEYFRDPTQEIALSALDPILHQLDGALAVLDQDEARRAVQHTRAAVQRFAQAGADNKPDPAECLHVAQNIGALSFFIDALQLNPDDAAKRFSFDETSGTFKARLVEKNNGNDAANGGMREVGKKGGQGGSLAPIDSLDFAPENITLPTVEDELALHQRQSAELAVSLSAEPDNPLLQEQLKQSLKQVRLDAALVDNPEANDRAQAGINLLTREDFATSRDALAQMITATVPVHESDISPSLPVVETPVTDEAIDAELLEIFLSEAQEVLETVRQTIPESRNAPNSDEFLTTLRRSFHTLKGSSRMVGLTAFGDAAWSIEQVLNLRLAESRSGDTDLYVLLEKAVEVLTPWVDDLQQQGKSVRNGLALIQAAERIKAGKAFSFEEDLPVPEVSTVPDLLDMPGVITRAASEARDLPKESIREIEVSVTEPSLDFPPLFPDLAEAIPQNDALEKVDMESEPVEEITDETTPLLTPDEVLTASTEESTEGPVAPVISQVIPPVPEDLSLADAYLALLQDISPAVDTASNIPPSLLAKPSVTGIEFPETERKHDDEIKHIGELEISMPLYNIYLAETDELVRVLSQDVAEWRHEPERHVSRQSVHAAHSLAGSSATVGFNALHEVAYALEMVFHFLARTPVQLMAHEFDLLEHTADRMKLMLQTFALGEMPVHEPEYVRVLESLKQYLETRSEGHAAVPIVEETTDPLSKMEADQAVPPYTDGASDSTSEEITDQALIPKDELDADLLPVFLEEGRDMLPQMGETLRAWQERPSNTAAPQSLLRLLHTLKGSARMAGAMALGQHLHDMETRIENLARVGSQSPLAIEDLLIRYDQGLQLFESLTTPDASTPTVPSMPEEVRPAEVAQPQSVSSEPVVLAPLMPIANNKLATAVAPSVKPASVPAPLVRVRSDILDRLVNQAGEVSISRSKLETEVGTLRQSLSELTENVMRLRDQLREIEMQAESQITSRMTHSADREFDPLEFDRFTRLQELTRMMAESVSDVGSVQQNMSRTLDSASDGLSTQARLTRDLQQDLMRVRMIQFASISERLFRVTRQTAKEMSKRVNLDIRGSAVELDRGVLEKMTGPFEHLLRNAIVHGIESQEGRRAAGKNETGELLIEVRQEGNEVVIQFSDDGQGLNLDNIKNKASRVGLLAGGSSPSDEEVVDLIFQPGFSTAEEVTELAGRGVGMDVVRSEAASLGGRIAIRTEPGKGAQFTIHLPLTLAVTQVVLLTSGGKSYAIPSVLVEQVQQLKSNPLATAYNDGAVVWQDQRVPMHYLPALLGNDRASPVAQHYSPLLILKSGNDRVAIHVDEILGNREVVVKNIGPQLSRMIGIAGATVLGSGEIVLILNPVALAMRAAQQSVRTARLGPNDSAPSMGAVAEMAEQSTMSNAAPVQGLRTQNIVMVVDDSLTVRRVTQRLLSREGYHVVLAKDGVEALQQLQSITPDVMLVDIEMPRMDGFDLTRNIRGDERTRHIPIVMITSRTAAKHRNYAMELGVNEYLGKPYREDDLLKLVAGFIDAVKVAS